MAGRIARPFLVCGGARQLSMRCHPVHIGRFQTRLQTPAGIPWRAFASLAREKD